MRQNGASGAAFCKLLVTQLGNTSGMLPVEGVLQLGHALLDHLLKCDIKRSGKAHRSKAGEQHDAGAPEEGEAVPAEDEAQPGGGKAARKARAGKKRRAAGDNAAAENGEDWASIMSGVQEICGGVCRLITEEAQQRAETATARAAAEAVAADTGAEGASRKGKGRKGKWQQQEEEVAELDEGEELLTADDVLPGGCLVALLEKAPSIAVRLLPAVTLAAHEQTLLTCAVRACPCQSFVH